MYYIDDGGMGPHSGGQFVAHPEMYATGGPVYVPAGGGSGLDQLQGPFNGDPSNMIWDGERGGYWVKETRKVPSNPPRTGELVFFISTSSQYLHIC